MQRVVLTGLQCACAFGHVKNLSMSHMVSSEAFQGMKIPIVLSELRTQPYLEFPLQQSDEQTGIRHFIQFSLIFAYMKAMAERAGYVLKGFADGYVAPEIMWTCLELTNIFNECYPYSTVFIIADERLVGQLLDHEGAVSLYYNVSDWAECWERRPREGNSSPEE